MVVRWAPPICIIKVQLVFHYCDVKAKHVSYKRPKIRLYIAVIEFAQDHCEFAKWVVTQGKKRNSRNFQMMEIIFETNFKERFGGIRLNPSGTHTEGEFGSTNLFCHGFFASKVVKNNKLEEVEPRGGGGRVRHSAAMGYFFARGH